MTDDQVDRIVLSLQKDREKFLESEKQAKAPKVAKVAAQPGLSLDDLDL